MAINRAEQTWTESETVMLNKYGEQVTPHGKVCSQCHQRVNGLKGYILDKNHAVICLHCGGSE